MTNRRLIIQRNSGQTIVDTPRTLFLVRLAWLLNKPLVVNALKDPFMFGDKDRTMIVDPLPDTVAIASITDDIVINDIDPYQSIETLPDSQTIEVLNP